MEKQVPLLACIIGLIATLVSATLAVETRYAKAEQVKEQLSELWSKQLKLRILEIQLKPSPLSSSDKALLDYLQQELREVTD